MLQRTFARSLVTEPCILLLDEPTRGIDIGSKVQVYETIAQCANRGKAVLMVSSYLPELFGMCHRLAVMSRGRLSPARPINEWTPESVMLTAVGGVGGGGTWGAGGAAASGAAGVGGEGLSSA